MTKGEGRLVCLDTSIFLSFLKGTDPYSGMTELLSDSAITPKEFKSLYLRRLTNNYSGLLMTVNIIFA